MVTFTRRPGGVSMAATVRLERCAAQTGGRRSERGHKQRMVENRKEPVRSTRTKHASQGRLGTKDATRSILRFAESVAKVQSWLDVSGSGLRGWKRAPWNVHEWNLPHGSNEGCFKIAKQNWYGPGARRMLFSRIRLLRAKETKLVTKNMCWQRFDGHVSYRR